MFDVSFSELMVIAVVALLVIGPEKLPKVARTVGAFTGRMQRYMAQIKEEVNREMRFEELQKLQQEIKQSVENTKEGIQQQMTEIQGTVPKISTPKTKSKVAASKPKLTKLSVAKDNKKTSTAKPKASVAKRVKVAAK